MGVGTRGDDPKYSGRSKASDRAASAPGTSRPQETRSPMSDMSSPAPAKAGMDDMKIRRRAKRSGYNHPAAVQSAPDLLYMPPEVSKKETPRANPWASENPAGVKSDRMVQLLRTCIDDKKKVPAVYQPPTRSDPITHQEFEDEEQFREATQIKGAAGVRTDRLTFLHTNWISTSKNTKVNKKRKSQQKTDPISHIGGPPDPITKGIRRFDDAQTGKSMVPMYHRPGDVQRLNSGEAYDLRRTREVRTGGGEVIYNHAGEEDMIPAATQNYIKADLPPSAAHKAENDRRWLPAFYKRGDNARPNPTLLESEDMYYSMYGADWADEALQSGGRGAADHLFDGGTYRPSTAGSGNNSRSRAKISREPSSTMPRSKSLDPGFVRRSNYAGSIADSEAQSYVSIDSTTRGMFSNPNALTLGSGRYGGETITL